MTWFKVDDSFYDHPKVFDAPDCAVALWTRAGTWSARNLTDGFVPAGMPARLCDDHDTAVRELLQRGLWSRSKGGYQFHGWRDYQPTSEEVKGLRSKRAEAGRKGGLAKAAKQNGSNGLASASPVAKQNAAPTRPDPTTGTGPYTGPGRNTRAREPDRPPPSDEPPSRVEQLITEYRDNSPRGLPSRQAEKLAAEIHQLVADGYTNLEIRTALGQLRTRKLGPGMLATLVDELANTTITTTPSNVIALRDTRPSTTDQRVAAGLALAAKYDALENQYDALENQGGPA